MGQEQGHHDQPNEQQPHAKLPQLALLKPFVSLEQVTQCLLPVWLCRRPVTTQRPKERTQRLEPRYGEHRSPFLDVLTPALSVDRQSGKRARPGEDFSSA
jgi:hypothetical protein